MRIRSFPSRQTITGTLATLLFATGCLAHEDITDEEPTAEAPLAIGGGDGQIDPPPSDLYAPFVSDSEIQLGWRCGSNQASNTRVMRSIGRDGTQEQIWSLPTCPRGQLRFVTSGVQPATEYCFVVIASNESDGAASDPFCVTSGLDTAAPALPTVTVASRTQTEIAWNIVDRATNESYIAFEYRKLGTADWRGHTFDRGVRAHRATGPVATLHSVPLEAGATYEYRTRIGHELAPVHIVSSISTASTAPPVPDVPVPDHFADITHDSATVFWQAAHWASEYTIRVVRRSSGSVVKTVTVGPQTSATITGLQPLTDYAIDVEAGNATGDSGRSSPIYLMTKAAPVVSHTISMLLTIADTPASGFLPWVGTMGPLINNARLTAIRPIGNFPTLTGLRFIRADGSNSDCATPGRFRFAAVGSSLTASDFTFLFGGDSLAQQIVLRACGEFAGQISTDWRPYMDVSWTEQQP